MINYLGPADPNTLTSTLLGMYGAVDGVPHAPGSPPADLNFFLYIETAAGMESVEVSCKAFLSRVCMGRWSTIAHTHR